MTTSLSSHMPKLSLPYLLREPLVPSEKPPLLLLFHGYGSNEEDLFALSADLPPEFLIISARAPLALGEEQYGWFALDWTTGAPVSDPKDADSARLVMRDFIDEVTRKFPVDSSRIFLLGFSQGAILSLSVALTFPLVARGVVVLSGKISAETKDAVNSVDELKNLPIFWGHGTDDQTIPLDLAYEGREYLEGLGVPLSFNEYHIGHGISIDEERDASVWLSGLLRQKK